MYLNFFSLKKEPFQITPDPSFLYLSQGHKEALASVIYGVDKKKGFVLIIGAVGVGKTTILRAYLEKCEKERLRTIYVFNSNISYYNLLKLILRELNIEPVSDEICELVNQLHQSLINEYREGRNVLLLIDEAQNMPIDTLENVRMLSNLETATEKLIQIVFSAQPEFEKTLNLEELKQLKQRIAVKAVISPLSKEEGLIYIQHRLKRAAEKESVIFTPYALKEIVKCAKGIPRVINVLCDNSMITAFGYGKRKIGLRIVNEITRDFGMKKTPYLKWCRVLLVASIVTGGVYWGVNRSAALIGARPQLPLAANQSPQRVSDQPSYTTKDKDVPKVRQTPTDIVGPSTTDTVDRRVVERGDTLAKLIREVYGYVDPRMIRLVKKANPHISNENLIIEGGQIVFPVTKGH